MKTVKWADGDMVIDRNVGRPFYIGGTRKAAQDVAHTLLQQTDEEHRIGCNISNFDERYSHSLANSGMVKMLVQQEAQAGIDRLVAWQTSQSAFITAGERITGINELLVSNESPSEVIFYVSVRVETEDILQYAYRVRLGHQYALNQKGLPLTDDTRP